MPLVQESDFQSAFFSKLSEFNQILDILDLLPGAMFMIKNRDSRYVYMSSTLSKAIHRASPTDVIGKTDFDLFPKIIAESFRQNDRVVFETGRPLINEIHITSFFSHEPRWSFSSKYPLRGRAGEVVGLVTLNEPYEAVMGRHENLNRLLPAIDHVFRHYSIQMTISTLASLCKLSESHFMRLFRERMNMTTHDFIEQVRMYHAIELLKQGNDSISQIAVSCGFYDHSAFVKRFRKFTGTTPLHYRKDHQTKRGKDRMVVFPQLQPGSPVARD